MNTRRGFLKRLAALFGVGAVASQLPVTKFTCKPYGPTTITLPAAEWAKYFTVQIKAGACIVLPNGVEFVKVQP